MFSTLAPSQGDGTPDALKLFHAYGEMPMCDQDTRLYTGSLS